MPSPSTDRWTLDDAAALALETELARRAAAPVRSAAQAGARLLLAYAAKARTQGGSLTPDQQRALRDALNAAFLALSVAVAVDVARAIQAAAALAVRQESALLAAAGLRAPSLPPAAGADPGLAHAGRDAQRSLDQAVAQLRTAAARQPGTAAELENLAARMLAPATSVERSVRWAANRAINTVTLQLAAAITSGAPPTSINGRTPLVGAGYVVVWVAERDACLTCLKLSGDVIDPNRGDGFDEDATFGKPGSAPSVWPPGHPLMGPPRHPNCRCRLRIILAADTAIPAALKREAERSVARGWSGHASRRSRLSAADALVRRANRLPRTVNERASRDVARAAFSTRHRPRTHLRAD